jgi:Flp pilus assembly protein TadB
MFNFLLETGLSAGGTLALFFAVVVFVGFALPSIFASVKRENYTLEKDRLATIRKEIISFSLMENFVNELTTIFWNRNLLVLQQVKEKLILLYADIQWKPEEFIATKQAEAIMIGIPTGIVFWNMINPIAGSVVAVVVAYFYYWAMLNDLAEQYKKRQLELQIRLPAVVDLMALTRGAGASFAESLESAAQENKGHPISDELFRVVRQLEHGTPQYKALNDLAERVKIKDFNEVVFAINKADELGTPLALTLTELASQMLLRKQQLAEKLSEISKTKIIMPVMLTVIACMIIVVAPFVLPMILRGGIGIGL